MQTNFIGSLILTYRIIKMLQVSILGESFTKSGLLVRVPSYTASIVALGTFKFYLQISNVTSNKVTHFNEFEKFIVQTQSKQKQANIDNFSFFYKGLNYHFIM